MDKTRPDMQVVVVRSALSGGGEQAPRVTGISLESGFALPIGHEGVRVRAGTNPYNMKEFESGLGQIHVT